VSQLSRILCNLIYFLKNTLFQKMSAIFAVQCCGQAGRDVAIPAACAAIYFNFN